VSGPYFCHLFGILNNLAEVTTIVGRYVAHKTRAPTFKVMITPTMVLEVQAQVFQSYAPLCISYIEMKTCIVRWLSS